MCLLIHCIITERLPINHQKKGKLKNCCCVTKFISVTYRMSLCLRFERNMKTYRILDRDLRQIQVFRDVTPFRLALPKFRKTVAISSSVQNNPWTVSAKNVLRLFETTVSTYQSARRNIPEDLNLQQDRCENLKSLAPYNIFIRM